VHSSQYCGSPASCSSCSPSHLQLRSYVYGKWPSWALMSSCICSGRHPRHNQINDMLCRAWFVSFETLATREARGLCTNTDKRPDGVTQLPWRRGRCLPWDATCTQTRSHRVTYLQATTRLVLPTSSHVYTLYRCYQNVGRLGKARSSRHVNNEIGRWIAAMAHEPRSVANL